MPYRKKSYRGRGKASDFTKYLKKANEFLKKTKILSKVGTTLAQDNPELKKYVNIAKMMGYGRRRTYRRRKRTTRGRGLKLAGQGLNPTGGSRGIRFRKGGVIPRRPLRAGY